MKSEDVAYIGLKILSICFSTKGIYHVIQYLNYVITHSGRNLIDANLELYSTISSITSMLLYLVVGIVLWVKTEKMVKHIVPKNNYSDVLEKANNKEFLLDVQIIAFSVVGLITFLNSIIYIYQYIGSIFLFDNKSPERFIHVFTVNLGGRILTLIIGLILLIKPKSIIRLIKRA